MTLKVVLWIFFKENNKRKEKKNTFFGTFLQTSLGTSVQTFSGTFFTESMQVSLGTLVHFGTLTVLGTLIGTFVQTFLVLYSQTSAPYPAGLGTQPYMEKMCKVFWASFTMFA